jgi:hypothetical protein
MSKIGRLIAKIISWSAITTFAIAACLFLAANPWRHPQYHYVFNLMLALVGTGIAISMGGLVWAPHSTNKRILLVALLLNAAGLLSVFAAAMLSASVR